MRYLEPEGATLYNHHRGIVAWQDKGSARHMPDELGFDFNQYLFRTVGGFIQTIIDYQYRDMRCYPYNHKTEQYQHYINVEPRAPWDSYRWRALIVPRTVSVEQLGAMQAACAIAWDAKARETSNLAYQGIDAAFTPYKKIDELMAGVLSALPSLYTIGFTNEDQPPAPPVEQVWIPHTAINGWVDMA